MGDFAPAQIAGWQAAVGRREVRHERLEAGSLRRYTRAVGADVEQVPIGHWAFFLPDPGDADIGGDGHPRRGGFLPDIPLPRRMFAASDIDFAAPLLVGEMAELESTIAAVRHKAGRAGDLVFVDVDRTIRQDALVRVAERQTYVYRGDGAPVALPDPIDAIEGECWQPDTVNLFRFSAATFNGHRIHYDLPYAREAEHYPDLVVHGPFTAAKLAAFAARAGRLARFTFRAQAPLFVRQPIRLQWHGENEVRAVRCDGVVAMTAGLQWATADAA